MLPGELKNLARRKNELLLSAEGQPAPQRLRLLGEAARLEGEIAAEYERRKDFLNASLSRLSQASCLLCIAFKEDSKKVLDLLLALPVNPSARIVAIQMREHIDRGNQ